MGAELYAIGVNYQGCEFEEVDKIAYKHGRRAVGKLSICPTGLWEWHFEGRDKGFGFLEEILELNFVESVSVVVKRE